MTTRMSSVAPHLLATAMELTFAGGSLVASLSPMLAVQPKPIPLIAFVSLSILGILACVSLSFNEKADLDVKAALVEAISRTEKSLAYEASELSSIGGFTFTKAGFASGMESGAESTGKTGPINPTGTR